jgi:hypothetical protein
MNFWLRLACMYIIFVNAETMVETGVYNWIYIGLPLVGLVIFREDK